MRVPPLPFDHGEIKHVLPVLDIGTATRLLQHEIDIDGSALHETMVMGFVLGVWLESLESCNALVESCSDCPDEHLKTDCLLIGLCIGLRAMCQSPSTIHTEQAMSIVLDLHPNPA